MLGGILSSKSEGNRARYQLVDTATLAALLRPLPARSGRWHLRLPLLANFVVLSTRLQGRDAVVQGVEARKAFTRWSPQIGALDLAPMPTAIAETYWSTLQQWLIENLISDPPGLEHTVDGMMEGVWLGPGQDVRKPASFGSAVLPRTRTDRVGAAELLCLDLVQVPTVEPVNDWAWAVLSTAATNVYSHTIGLDRGEAWRFATWSSGRPRVYAASYDEPLAPEQLARLYGGEAAARARADRPAVQLRLRRVSNES